MPEVRQYSVGNERIQEEQIMDIFDEVIEERSHHNLSKRKAIVVDYGHFLSHAVRLAQDFGETFYVPFGWKGSFARPEKSMIGDGIKGITCVPDFFDAKKEIDPERDLIAFFDVGDGAMAEDLRKQGYKRVFSMGKSEIIEQNRYKFKELLESVGLPVIPYNGGDWRKGHVIGLTALEKRLKEIDGPKWVKLSTYRGLSETFKFESFIQVQSILAKMRHDAGAYAEKVQFLIEDDLPAREGGSDNLFSDGHYFSRCLQGYEEKGEGYFSKVIETRDLPKSLLTILGRLAPYLKSNGARGMLSTEVRVTKEGKAYFTDATQRSGNPPGDLQTAIWKNFPHMVYAAAGGEIIAPIPAGKYGVQLNLHSSWAEHETMVIEFPEKIADSVKLRNVAFIDGHYQYIPQSEMISIGSVVGIANSPEEAYKKAVSVADQVKGQCIEYDKNLYIELTETIKEAEKIGLGKF